MPKDISNGIKFETDDKLIEMGVKGAEVTAHVNKAFLEAETTKYPVIIDPTITIEKSNNKS